MKEPYPQEFRRSMVFLRQLTARVWTASYSTYRTLVVDGDSSVFLVNSFGVPAVTSVLRGLLDEAFPGKPVSALVQTIDHLDHTGAGDQLNVSGDVIGHHLTAQLITRRNVPGQLAVTRTVNGGGETVELDGVRVELIYAGPTVGTGNLAVLIPDEGVLFVVGPQENARYGIMPDFHLRHVSRIWRKLADREAEIVVPGRFGCFDSNGLRVAADYVDALSASCQRAFAQGLPIWEVDTMGAFVQAELQDDFGHLGGFDEHIAAAAIRVVHFYLMGGWGIEDSAHPDLLLA